MMKEVKTFKDLLSLLNVVKHNEDFLYVTDTFDKYCDWVIKCFYNSNCKIVMYNELGYLICTLFDDIGKKVFFLNDVFVLPDYRGKGIGGLLVGDFIYTGAKVKADISRCSTRTLSEEFIQRLSKQIPYEKYSLYDFHPTEEKSYEKIKQLFGGLE